MLDLKHIDTETLNKLHFEASVELQEREISMQMEHTDASIGVVILAENEFLHNVLLVVEEVYPWGVLAAMEIPYKGKAYFRVNYSELQVVGYIGKLDDRS